MSDSSGKSTVLWWIGWIVLTIVAFFISCYFWTGIIARHVGPMDKPGVPIVWVSAVFGTWMVLLVPLIVIMYSKVDKAYEDARITRESKAQKKAQAEFGAQSVFVEKEKRLLPAEISKQLKKWPETIRGGHLVSLVLKNGKRIDNVFIYDKKEVLGVYGYETMPFAVADIQVMELADGDAMPNFEAKRWLRLDGAGSFEQGR